MKESKTFCQIALALISFIVSQIVLAGVLYYMGLPYFDPANWLKHDSDHYMKIATSGYEFLPCSQVAGYSPDSTDYCGNTAWFPGYSFVVFIVSALFGNSFLVAGIISKFFYLVCLFLVVRILDIRQFSFKNFALVLIPAFCFGFIYYNAVFPISLLLACILSSFYFFLKDKIWQASLFCFLAAVVYSTGFLWAVVLATFILIKNIRDIKSVIAKSFLPLFMGFMGVISVFIFQHLTVGDWQAFSKVQAKYGHGIQSPIKNIGAFFKKPDFLNFNIEHFIHYQTLLVLLGFVILSIYFFKDKMYGNNLYLLTYVYLFWYIFFPWTVGGDLSMYRAESMLLPFVFLLKETKTSTLAIILSFALFIGVPMSYLFFTTVLI